MENEQKQSRFAKFNYLLATLSYIGVLITLILIVIQIYYAKQTMTESNEWEKAKVTIENIQLFKEKLKETALYGNNEILWRADRGFPDFTTFEGYQSVDTLRHIYNNLFDGDYNAKQTDFLYTLSVMDDFAYPIIMGYASETGSYRSVYDLYLRYGNYILPDAFHLYKPSGQHAKLLHRLWRVKGEILYLPNWDSVSLRGNMSHLLCFEGDEVTPATLKQYGKKLEKELKKIQKEIEDFRKNSLK